jgi:hypothetical protein
MVNDRLTLRTSLRRMMPGSLQNLADRSRKSYPPLCVALVNRDSAGRAISGQVDFTFPSGSAEHQGIGSNSGSGIALGAKGNIDRVLGEASCVAFWNQFSAKAVLWWLSSSLRCWSSSH